MHPMIVRILLMLLAAPLAAQEARDSAAERWTPELLFRYRAIEGVAVAPAGDRIAYVVREPIIEAEKSEFVNQIWLATTDGRSSRQLTQGDASATSPAFSPDGRWLAYTTSRGGPPQLLWALPLDGGEAFQVTAVETGVAAFAWAPHGRSIAFLASDPKTEEEKKAEREKRDVIVLERAAHGFNGRAPGRNLHLHVVAFTPGGERSEARRLTQSDFHIDAFDWSPDGRRIVFEHRPDRTSNTWLLAGDLSIVDVDSREVRPLVTSGGVELSPRFSPDGRHIAFASTGTQPSPAFGLEDVYVVDATGGQPRRLAHLPDRSLTAFGGRIVGWARDGRSLYVSQAVRTERHLYELPADGGAPRQFTTDGGVYFHVAMSGDGSHLAFTYENAVKPHDIYISPIPRFAMTRVTDLHGPLPRPLLGRTEVIQWRSKDGREVEGLLTYPVSYRDGARVPLVVKVHGGPDAVWSMTFKEGEAGLDGASTQYFAQGGFAVLRPNPRGSTGYGSEFRSAVVGDMGQGPLNDILSGVDHVIALGVAHPDSLVITGGSYGGYMTAFAVTRTDRFKAASMIAAPSNLVSKVTTTDIPDHAATLMGSEPWDNFAAWQEQSPIHGVANVTTPTQVIVGREDPRVPITQGLEFYNALRRRGVATQMVIYPRTGHGPPGEPKFLVDLNHRIVGWFNRHLGRAGRGSS
jgi:dipeptidyl aminopeptidase/acylaminoacyl peptidase